jgi:hypothetical protein
METISHPDIRVKYCAYGYYVASHPRDVTTVSHKYSSTVSRYTTVVVAASSTAHYPANYEIKIYYVT